jgi:2-beta-glucuronyltransferase
MNRVILVSWLIFNSKRKAGFHWLADAFWKMGWDVVFVTAPLASLLAMQRFPFSISTFQGKNKLVNVKEHLWSYVL